MKKIFYFLPVAALALLAACGGNDSEPELPNDGGNDDGGGAQANVEADKQHITEVANDISKLFKPEDQKELVDLGIDFSELYADLDIPTEWESLDGSSTRKGSKSLLPGNYINLLVRGMRHGNSTALTRAATNYVYNYSLSQISGIYEPSLSSGRWVKRQNSSSLIFRFNDARGVSCELNVTGSGDEGIFSSDYEGETHNVFIPGTVTVRLTHGSNELAKGVVKSSLNVRNTNLNDASIDADLRVMNLNLKTVSSVTNSQMNQTVNFTVSGKDVMNLTANASGSNLNNPEIWDEDHMENVFRNGRAEGNIMNQLGVNANINFSKTFFDGWEDEYWSSYDGVDKATALANVKIAASKINSAGNIYLLINGSKRAQIVVSPVLDEWGYDNQNWEYYLEPCVKFNDGTTYSMDDYGDMFSSAFDVFDQLAETYEKAFNIK